MKMNCPICAGEMSEYLGNQVHRGDKEYGVMVYCPHLGCMAQEVMGHGDNAKQAFEIVMQKYKKT